MSTAKLPRYNKKEKEHLVNEPVKNFWQLRLLELQKQLQSNNFDAYVVDSGTDAGKLIAEKIAVAARAETVSHGGSVTLANSGALDRLENVKGVQVIRLDQPNLSNEEKGARRRQGLLVDLYLTGTNAITEDGHLVNLDMLGNRVAAMTFGPKKVVVLAGRNKIVPDLETAMFRIKDYAAPANAMRLDCKTPCVKTSVCADCSSPGRICNYWTITEKSFPEKRIAVILINEDLGL
ncbi:MAG: lactate utilization protein [Desulforhopalus sp.]